MEIELKAGVPETEFSQRFVQGMADRMALSFFKYGAVADAYPHKVDAIESLKKRLARYEEKGNLEELMDLANFALIEFIRPKHPAAHFVAEDSAASPGRVWNTGHVGQDANTHAREHTRTGGLYSRDGD